MRKGTTLLGVRTQKIITALFFCHAIFKANHFVNVCSSPRCTRDHKRAQKEVWNSGPSISCEQTSFCSKQFCCQDKTDEEWWSPFFFWAASAVLWPGAGPQSLRALICAAAVEERDRRRTKYLMHSPCIVAKMYSPWLYLISPKFDEASCKTGKLLSKPSLWTNCCQTQCTLSSFSMTHHC